MKPGDLLINLDKCFNTCRNNAKPTFDKICPGFPIIVHLPQNMSRAFTFSSIQNNAIQNNATKQVSRFKTLKKICGNLDIYYERWTKYVL